MHYNYKCGNETIEVFVWTLTEGETCDRVTVNDRVKQRGFERTVHEDEGGSFFTWNKNKIYLNDWIRIPMSEVKRRFEEDDWVTSTVLCQAILTEGVENVRFIITDNDDNEVLCKIREEWNSYVKQNYKIIFVPVDESDTRKFDFYTMDLVGLLRMKIFKIV